MSTYDLSDNYYIGSVKISKSQFEAKIKAKTGYISNEMQALIDVLFDFKFLINTDETR